MVTDDVELGFPLKLEDIWLLLVLVALHMVECNSQREVHSGYKDSSLMVILRSHACFW
jgi:hypothetical protein